MLKNAWDFLKAVVLVIVAGGALIVAPIVGLLLLFVAAIAIVFAIIKDEREDRVKDQKD